MRTGAAMPFDTALLNGFRFACRPECALCCYTTPAVTPPEAVRLERTTGELPVVTLEDGRTVIRDWPNGGPCRMLAARRCSVHEARPGPCSSFPVTVHGNGRRWQASLVLSCPGLALGPLAGWSPEKNGGSFEGLDGEVSSAHRRTQLAATQEALSRDVALRKRAGRALKDVDPLATESRVREELARDLPLPLSQDLPGELPPSFEEGPEYLPLVWEGPGRVAGLENTESGLRAIDLDPYGKRGRSSEVVPLPRTLPRLTPDARALLEGYLRYWLHRDALFDWVLWELLQDVSSAPLLDRAREALRVIGATAVTRGVARGRMHGIFSSVVGEEEVRLGIQATDMDLLDRPSLGVRI